MSMTLFKKTENNFLTVPERNEILHAIQNAEKNTSGEIRIYIESKCKLVKTLNHAENIFYALKMQNTVNQNAVLIYIAFKDKDFAVYGDRGCIIQFAKPFWKKQVATLSTYFYKHKYKEGILKCIADIGEELKLHFPHKGENKNELPDEIVFGK